MNTRAEKTSKNKDHVAADHLHKQQGNSASTFQFEDNRPESIVQRKLQESIKNSPGVQQLSSYQEMANNSPQLKRLEAYQSMADNFTQTAQLKKDLKKERKQEKVVPIQKKENATGLPQQLKSGIENLSGYSMDDVNVHYNSDKPAQLNAHAYAQGSEIHIAPGKEKHLPHEAWHTVQQKQGRVKPTTQLKGKVNVNDDAGLEKEADMMGQKALHYAGNSAPNAGPDLASKGEQSLQLKKGLTNNQKTGCPVQCFIIPGRLNVVGENHKVSGREGRKEWEKKYSEKFVGGKFWKENEFRVEMPGESMLTKANKLLVAGTGRVADPFVLRVLHNMLFLRDEVNTPRSTYMTLQEWVGSLNSNINNLKNSLDGDDMSKTAQTELKEMADFFAQCERAKPEAATALLKKNIDAIINKWRIIASKEDIDRNKTDVGEHKKLGMLEADNFDAMKKITSDSRSIAMHLSAIEGNNSGKVGVWKIGQKHMSDIYKLHKNEYPITDEADFVEDVDNYFRAVKSKVKDPKAAVDEARSKKEQVRLGAEREEQKRQADWDLYLKSKECADVRSAHRDLGAVDLNRLLNREFLKWQTQKEKEALVNAASERRKKATSPASIMKSVSSEYDGYLAKIETLKEEVPLKARGAIFMIGVYLEIDKKRELEALGSAVDNEALSALATSFQVARKKRLNGDFQHLKKDLYFNLMMESPSQDVLEHVIIDGYPIHKLQKPIIDEIDNLFHSFTSNVPWLKLLASLDK